MPPKSRGRGDAPESRPHGFVDGRAGTAQGQGEILTEVSQQGRSRADGGTGVAAARPAQSEDLLTRQSGRPGGAPRGRPKDIKPGEDAEVRRSLEMENSGAVVLAGQGYDVYRNPSKAEVAQARLDAGDTGDPGKDPDYLLEGRVFDCYSPVKASKVVRGIWTEAKEKVEDGQTQRVVVNLEDWRGDISALSKQFADWPVPGLKEVKAITRGGEILQINLPPYQPMEEY